MGIGFIITSYPTGFSGGCFITIIIYSKKKFNYEEDFESVG